MIKGTVVLNAFCLAFTFSNIFRLTLWSIFKQAENRRSKQGKGIHFQAVIKLDVLGSNKVSQIPRAVKLLPSGLLFCTSSGKLQEKLPWACGLRNAARW